MAEMKIMNLAAMQHYDEKIKAFLAAADEAVLAAAKAHAEGLADNYDAAGTAATKMKELADGAVAANTAAIAKLNGSAEADGSVAKQIADAKALIDADVAALAADVGDVDNLETTNKEVVAAINEVRDAVGTGGTAAVVTVVAKGANDNYANVYEISQGGNVVGTINIPKDFVVQAGEVVTNPEGMDAGTYIKLTLANVADPLYINVGTLVDIYKAKANATQIQIAIDSATREVSASIVAGSVGVTELADNAVVTAKIADGNVTKAKLSTAVQASLDKADVAEQNAKDYADGLNNDMNTRVEALENVDHDHANKAELDLIETGDVAKWNAARANAEKTAADALAAAKTELEGKITAEANRADAAEKQALADAKAYADEKVAANETAISGHADRLTTLEGKVGDGFVAITNAEIDAMFA